MVVTILFRGKLHLLAGGTMFRSIGKFAPMIYILKMFLMSSIKVDVKVVPYTFVRRGVPVVASSFLRCLYLPSVAIKYPFATG